jgi:porphobilinogen synthase
MRRMVAETRLSVDELVYPMFVCPGKQVKDPIEAMDDCFRFSPDLAAKEAAKIADLGIPAILLFGTGEKKDAVGSHAWSADSAVCQAIDKIKAKTPDLLVITDVCLCAYTSHGHCGVIRDKRVDNDSTLEILAKMAFVHAKAGADIVAPSDMMDGRVGVIREALDEEGFSETSIMSYSSKFASAFYGPFRDAAQSTPAFGDRKTYQIDPACGRQTLRQMQADIEQGADIVMIKPALAYLDIIAKARQRFDVPIAAYNVSGEYMMIKMAAKAGLLDLQSAMMETLLSIKRAGANIIITYFAPEVAKVLNS